jgi:Phage tail assembly chaperone protein, TAC
MTTITIKEKEYKARCDFKFERLANEKYSEKAEGQDIDGFMSIYLGLLQYSNTALLGFWDCSLSHYKKDKPTLEDIEDVIADQLENDEDPFETAFQALDRAGFFKKRAQKIRDGLLSNKKLPIPTNETEEAKKEREEKQAQADEVSEELQKAYNELTGSDTTKE